MPVDLHRPVTNILLVEDNRIDAHLLCRAIAKVNDWPTRIHVLDDGDKAIKWLAQDNLQALGLKPDLIILDMNLPKRDGTEVLGFIRHQGSLRSIPVFIFSSSPVDIARESTSRANVTADRYFEKPYEVGNFQTVTAEIRKSFLLISSGSLGASA